MTDHAHPEFEAALAVEIGDVREKMLDVIENMVRVERRVEAVIRVVRDQGRALTDRLDRQDQVAAERFAALESRLGGLESRLDGVESRLDAFESRTEARFDAIDGKLDAILQRLAH